MTCEIVKDLIPMYVDKTASAETDEAVRNHIQNCPDCRSFCRLCRIAEEKSRFEKEDGYVNASADSIEQKYAGLSKKLKRRKILQIVFSCLVAAGLLAYIVVDIMNSLKNKD